MYIKAGNIYSMWVNTAEMKLNGVYNGKIEITIFLKGKYANILKLIACPYIERNENNY